MLAGVLEEVRECGGRGEERLAAPWTHPLDSPDLALHKVHVPPGKIRPNHARLHYYSGTSHNTYIVTSDKY